MEKDAFSRRIEFDNNLLPAHEMFRQAVEMGEQNKGTTLATVAVYIHMTGEEFIKAIKRDGKVTMQVASFSRNAVLKKVAVLRAFNDLCMCEGTPPAMRELHEHVLAVLLQLDQEVKEA